MYGEKEKVLEELVTKQEEERCTVGKIERIHSELIQIRKDEIDMMKEQFITVVNEAKTKLRRCFGMVHSGYS
jgi:hypothetical protein